MSELTHYTPPTDTLAERISYAESIAPADLLPVAYRNKPANVLIAVETGDALGIPRIQALSSINVINGRPSMSAELMGSIVRRAGHKLRVKRSHDPLTVTAELVRADDPDYAFTATWDQGKATVAGLWGKDQWKRYPEAMLTARAISEVCRMGAPDALMGVVYTPEEARESSGERVSAQGGLRALMAESKPTAEDSPAPVEPDPAPEPAPEPEAEDVQALITDEQADAIAKGFAYLGHTTKKAQNDVWRFVTGHLPKTGEATEAEAEQVLAYLREQATSTPDPAA